MGIRLVQSALGPQWFHLTERARLTLAHMALRAHDTGTPNSRRAAWWEGHDTLMLKVLGLTPEQLTEAEYRAALWKIKRAIRELRDAGAIEVIEPGRRGRNTVYRVLAEGPLLPVDNSAVDAAEGPLLPVDNSAVDAAHGHGRDASHAPQSEHPMHPYPPVRGAPGALNGVHPMHPRGEQEEEEEQRTTSRGQLN